MLSPCYPLKPRPFFRWQLFSGFDLLSGNSGDTKFIVAIHEHLFQVLHGRGTLLSPPFFYDTPGTLGYSDAFILNEALYAPLRLLGAEPFLALELVPMLLSAPAYLFTFLFLRRFAGASAAVATAGALLFTFPNNLYLKSGQVQHFVAYYLPIVLYCATSAIANVHRARVRSCFLGAAAGSLYGLCFSTGYYISWFFGIALMVFAPIFIWQGWPAVRNWWQVNPRSVLVLASTFAASFIVALIPFVLIYLPAMRNIGPRSFAEYLFYAPQFVDAINVGPSNIFWGRLVRHLVPDRPEASGELSIAITPLVWVLVGAAALIAAAQRPLPTDSSAVMRRAAVLGCAAVCVGLFLVTIKVGSLSLFRIFYALVPGAAAIRAGCRAMIVANLFAVIAFALGCAGARPLLSRRRFGFPASLGLALLALAVVEQINFAPTAHLSRAFDIARLQHVQAAPSSCRSFYVSDERKRQPYGRAGAGKADDQRIFRPVPAGLGSVRHQGRRLRAARGGVDRQPKARGCLSRRRRGGNLDVFTIMSRRAAPKQASQTRKPTPQAKPASQTPKPNRSGSPSMSRLSAALDAGTIPGRFPAGAGRPSGGSLRRANQN